ncbi:DNA primase [Zymobacter sp. IVIA_12111.31 C1]|uniref:DNA primase n=1 Tax=Zymobacter sp. IVIA_12111.31 C1 TaxID=3394854 RepID=UPI0039C355FD
MAGPISQRFIDDLLARVDIAEVVGERVTLKKAGKNLSGLCPFHDEKSPSFTVSRDKQFYHCFGCGAHGNAIRFLMEYDRLSFPEAVEQLASRQGMEVEREGGNLSPHDQKRQQQQRQQRQEADNLLEMAQRFFLQNLKHDDAEEARRYLRQRGLSDDIMARFGIGFAFDRWDALKAHLLQQGVSEALQTEYGLLVQKEETGRSYDRFRHRVMFPIRDWKGRVLGFGGRVLGDAKPKYLNSPETPVFHKGRELYGLYEAREQKERCDSLIVVEGYMDVVALAQHGITNAVATLGTAVTEDHLQRMYRLVDEVVFCFDGDDAGRRAAKRALEHVLPVMIDGRQARFLFLPEGEDPDSLVRREGTERFRDRIRCASALSEFLFDQAKEGLDLGNIESRERYVTSVLGLLERLPEGLLRSLLFKELSDRSGIKEERLTSLAALRQQGGHNASPDVTAEPAGHIAGAYERREPSVRRSFQQIRPAKEPESLKILRLILHTPGLHDHLPESLGWCPQDEYGALLADVIQLLRAGRYTSPQAVLAHYHGSEQGMFLRTLSRHPPDIPRECRQQELDGWIAFLKRRQQTATPQEEYDALLEKSRHTALSKEEKQRVAALLMELAAQR